MLLLWAVALAAPEVGLGFEAPSGALAWDAFGGAHVCLPGSFLRSEGRHGGGVELVGEGGMALALGPVEELSIGANLSHDGDGVVFVTGDLVVAVRAGRVVVEGLSTLDAGDVSDGAWTHVVVGTGSGVVKVFVEGVEVASGPADGAVGDTLWIGGSDEYAADGWRGRIDDVTLSRAFPDASLAADALEVAGGPTGDGVCDDYDLDGLVDQSEVDLGLDPEALDSDSDSFTDQAELPGPGWPLDTDGDGVPDAIDPDDDGDGIPSIDERVADGDGDGAPDLDLDGDGLDNGTDLDSDGDGIPDAEEGAGDSDGDGIADYMDTVDDAPTAPAEDDGAGAGEGRAAGGDEGCGCRLSGSSLPSSLPWLVLGLVARRRRRP